MSLYSALEIILRLVFYVKSQWVLVHYKVSNLFGVVETGKVKYSSKISNFPDPKITGKRNYYITHKL